MTDKEKTSLLDVDGLVRRCVEICEDRKALKVVLYDMRGKSVLADYYLICSGTSEPHLNAIAGAIHKQLVESGVRPKSVQGTSQSHWVILDYGTVLIHVFTPECRDFYKIEQLWPEEMIAYASKEDDKSGFLDNNWSYKG